MSKDGCHMVPRPVVVCEGAHDLRQDIRSGGLVERRTESSVGFDPELPRIAPALDPAVVGRGIRRPIEPCRDREIQSRHWNGRCNDFLPSAVEIPCAANLTCDVRRSYQCTVIPIA